MTCGVARRRGSDPALLWLWPRPAAAALIRPLAWDSPYAAGAALEKTKKKKKKKKKKRKNRPQTGRKYFQVTYSIRNLYQNTSRSLTIQ